MKFLKLFHNLLINLFAVVNGIMLYLFLMGLPYGLDPFIASLHHWEKLSPEIGIMFTLGLVLTALGIVLPRQLSAERKNQLLYFRGSPAHPAFNAFLNTRRQPFESKTLLAAHPEVKDTGFNPAFQVKRWKELHDRYQKTPVVINTRLHWQILRDLYLVSLLFLGAFLLGWLWHLDTPFQLVAIYVFVFGAQVLFLLLSARRIGWKMVDNVLAVDLGMKEGDSLDNSDKKTKGSKRA